MATNIPVDQGGLTLIDDYWRKLQPFLEECGYMLRPRFRPGWTPSWEKPGAIRLHLLHEDGWPPTNWQVIDTVRLKDGVDVAIKKVITQKHPNEVNIATFLTSLTNDPTNHCVPLLDVLYPPILPGTQLLILPLLRTHSSPNFDTIGECVDFFRQIFEGIHFMHRNLVAHRDCCSTNIMMDGQRLYPYGCHPQFRERSEDLLKPAKHLTRTQAPPRYIIIDFGISVQFQPEESPRHAIPIKGGDDTVPEFEGSGADFPRDPFPTDVYFLGNLIRQEFLDDHAHGPLTFGAHFGREGFEFMRPLVSDMIRVNPEERPTMDEVVARFETIVAGLSTWKLRSRARGKEEYTILSLPKIIRHWYRRVGFMLRGVPPIP
ncbi:hypothetical protein B0H15DRAFT_899862 [Mycena belliarum]|uniref:Protein kinase domain-containing protein n=1 Tax=Mycena belliarum TaxID=1033014 RepID=A0AAD6UFS0_9AGAR|nr:hypothetical protein B0H15DRAFT_899862 [Mycena belliae]